MTARRFSVPALPEIAKGKTDHFVIGTMRDLAELAEQHPGQYHAGSAWGGKLDRDQAIRCLREGHVPSVRASDEFLKKVEELAPAPTARHELIDDVIGAVPNVPAFLAGQPLNMRRKIKRESENAPVAVVVDLTSSASVKADDLAKRGAAILALVRVLTSRRPVELYAGTGVGTPDGAMWQFYKIETAPLDLARAAFLLAHPAATRGLQYMLGYKLHNFTGQWPYNAGAMTQHGDKFRKIIARALPHVTDVVAIPSIYGTDHAISDPVRWITEHVATLDARDALEAA
jgi:hypothetical protein